MSTVSVNVARHPAHAVGRSGLGLSLRYQHNMAVGRREALNRSDMPVGLIVMAVRTNEGTKEGLAAARAKGRRLGRPKGARGKSKLDGKEEEIRLLLQKRVSTASIAKILGVSRTAMHHFINSRKLDSNASQPQQSRAHHP